MVRKPDPAAHRGRSRINYANVIATIALFVALGSGAHAALSSGGSGGTIKACYQKHGGELRLLKSKKCRAGERPISWGVKGPSGPPGSQGLQGDQGPAGTARAYGYVAYDGKLSQSKNASVTHLPIAEDSINCISVPGVSAVDTPIMLTPEVSEDSNLFTGETIFSGGKGFTGEWGTTFVVWDRQHPHCTASQWEIRGYSLLAEDEIAEGNITVVEVGEPFSFVVP